MGFASLNPSYTLHRDRNMRRWRMVEMDYSAQPPSIKWVWPLMKADSSEAR